MIKLTTDFNSTKELLEWRKENLMDLMDKLSKFHQKEYQIRIKEINWLISKLDQKVKP